MQQVVNVTIQYYHLKFECTLQQTISRHASLSSILSRVSGHAANVSSLFTLLLALIWSPHSLKRNTGLFSDPQLELNYDYFFNVSP